MGRCPPRVLIGWPTSGGRHGKAQSSKVKAQGQAQCQSSKRLEEARALTPALSLRKLVTTHKSCSCSVARPCVMGALVGCYGSRAQGSSKARGFPPRPPSPFDGHGRFKKERGQLCPRGILAK